MDWYKDWFTSPYYKILYQNRDEVEAQEFVENLLAYLTPPQGSDMLDIACGEGRFAKQLAGHGFDVTGIDISHQSIAIAKAYEADNLQFFVQDMRFPFYINYFGYAFNFFTSFGYFTNQRDHTLAAKAFAAALKQNGILVIDYFNCDQVIANLVPEETLQRGSYTFQIKRAVERDHILKEISFTDMENVPRRFTESVAAFSLSDFIKMFRLADMSLVTAFGDYKLGPFHPADSPRLILVFKKKYA
jgi:SAM-dependent methyltransferase